MPDQKVQDQLQQLQLEEALAVASDRKSKRARRENKIKAVELSLKRDREQRERTQELCVHRKGGKGKDGIYNGNDQNYAVITHTFAHGPTKVFCQRCGKVWAPPAKLGKKATADDRAQYRIDLAEYRRALAFPTDNEPSGTVLFEIHHDEDEAA